MARWAVNFDMRVQADRYDIVSLVARAHALATVIRGIPIPPGLQRKIDALNILRAVRGTTGIEGTELTETEVLQVMESPGEHVLPKGKRREELEVRNAERVMYLVATTLIKKPDTPLTEGLICLLHKTTTEDIPYRNNTPGKYRDHAAHAGTYLPPATGQQVRELMAAFVDWFNNGPVRLWDPIIKAILAPFYVVSIHPFGDGDGRTARAVESLLLYQAGVNARGFYSLANYYYRRRDEYVAALDHVRFHTNGDLTPFVTFALNGLVEELEAVHNEVLREVQIISFRDFAREVLEADGKMGTKIGERVFHFLLRLGPDAVSIKALRAGAHPLSRHYRGVTGKTLSRDVNYLKERELIVVDGDDLRANLGIMTRFTPPLGLFNLPPPTKKRRLRQPGQRNA